MRTKLLRCVGTSPLLMDRLPDELLMGFFDWPRGCGPREKSPLRQAAEHIYRDRGGHIALPTTMIHSAILKAMEKTHTDFYFLQPVGEFTKLRNPDGQKIQWRPDIRHGRLDNGIRLQIIRARFDQWAFSILIQCYDPNLSTQAQDKLLVTLLNAAGSTVGLGSLSPKTGGTFGRFEVLPSSGVSASAA